MTVPSPAEIEAAEAEDRDFFARHRDRRWRLRMAMPIERAAAVAVHRCGRRVGLTPCPPWSAPDDVIEAIVRRSLPAAAWQELEAAIARGRP